MLCEIWCILYYFPPLTYWYTYYCLNLFIMTARILLQAKEKTNPTQCNLHPICNLFRNIQGYSLEFTEVIILSLTTFIARFYRIYVWLPYYLSIFIFIYVHITYYIIKYKIIFYFTFMTSISPPIIFFIICILWLLSHDWLIECLTD